MVAGADLMPLRVQRRAGRRYSHDSPLCLLRSGELRRGQCRRVALPVARLIPGETRGRSGCMRKVRLLGPRRAAPCPRRGEWRERKRAISAKERK